MSWRKKNRINHEINPDEIFLDSSNLPQFDTHQFEGRLEKPISRKPLLFLGVFFLFLSGLFLWKVVLLQIFGGESFRERAENNRLRQTLIPTERGVIFDRNGTELAWNEPFPDSLSESAERKYIRKDGFAHVLGFIQYPAKDKSGFFYQEETEGKDGVELAYDALLRGKNGLKIVETNVLGELQTESVVRQPVPGSNIVLSIDARVQEKFFEFLKNTARSVPFSGGAGILLDIHSGEILSLVSFPEYDPATLSLGNDEKQIARYVEDANKPFLNRAVSGLYVPGSIVKPFLAMGALSQGIITPEEEILSTGSISIPNPYHPDEKSVFNDWKAHGLVDMRKAIAVSSNVYFFEIGGGFENQKGLGIKNIERYMRLFGFGEKAGIDLAGEEKGLIPTPQWKVSTFGDPWRIGDTYNTAIGQYGFQITPVQAVQAIAAIADDGVILRPHIVKSDGSAVSGANLSGGDSAYTKKPVNLPREHFLVVREGLREAVTGGTAQGLNLPFLNIAAKTGTAELDEAKKYVNSWVIGFFPYEKPHLAFAVVMEHGSRNNLIGALYVARQLFEWMAIETPEYLK